MWGYLVHQVFEFRVNEWENDPAGPVQDGSTFIQSSRFGAPGLGLEFEVDCVQCHSKEVSNQSHGFGCQPGEKQKGFVNFCCVLRALFRS